MSEKIVYVTNTSSETLVDQWDGKKIEFPPNIDVAVTESLARQFFGWQQEDRSPQIARLGWSYTKNDLKQALARLDKFVIREAPKSAQPKNAKERPLYVVNNGNSDFSGKYDGKNYDFPRGESVPIPEAVAVHLFGHGKSNKIDECHRLGIDPAIADKFFDSFSITKTPPQKKRAA